ncbi:MAG TPA: hypothetical protein VGS96_08800 [Thermoanaerobaculia bacterium]|jgi:hypothetical protein|nr:hypothetical protein [Thermoanaerobaculia bacterium]
MSADKRKTILIAFAGLAVVLVAVIAIVSPSFRSEDATGAIGAVQKHRQPQITKNDVILGSEKQQQEQKVLYRDYLTDAATLQNLAADFSVAAKRIDARAKVQTQQRQVAAQFYEDIDATVVDMRRLAEEDASVGVKIAQIDELAARARARNLNQPEIESLSARLREMADSLGAAAVASHKLAAAEAAVESMNLDAARSNLAAAQANLAAMVHARAEYAQEMAKEIRVLAMVESGLGQEAVSDLGARLRSKATDLEARAVANMRDQLRYDQEAIEALGKMADSISRAQNKANVESFNNYLAAVDRDVQNEFALDIRAQFEAISTHVKQADSMGVRVNNNDFAEQLTALGALAENKNYAQMLSNAPAFATEARTLAQEMSLDARKK